MSTIRRGRKRSKLSEELIEEVCQIVREGNYVQTAIKALGIKQSTFYYWLKKGREGKNKLCKKLVEKLDEAMAEAERACVLVLRAAAISERDWKAALAWLERRFPERWGRKEPRTASDGEKQVHYIVTVADEADFVNNDDELE